MNAFTDHSRQQHFHSFESASRDELIHRYAELRRGELRCVHFSRCAPFRHKARAELRGRESKVQI